MFRLWAGILELAMRAGGVHLAGLWRRGGARDDWIRDRSVAAGFFSDRQAAVFWGPT